MPVPMMNIINGGAHADNSVDIQEFMILPMGAPSLSEALRYGAEVFHTLKKMLHAKGLNTAVGDEGGFAPGSAVERGGARRPSWRPSTRRDTAPAGTSISASTWRAPSSTRTGVYELESEGRTFSAAANSPIIWPAWSRSTPSSRVEDGMSEGDWDGWALLTRKLGSKVQLVGDDIFVTNTKIFAEGIAKKIANAILIKPNQIGTLTETAGGHRHGGAGADMPAMVSHRSGRNRGRDHCRHRGGDRGHADQDRLDVALGSHRQIQPVAAHRGANWVARPAYAGERALAVPVS